MNMQCKFISIISAYVDSEASALEQAALLEHIKTCQQCKDELASQYALRDMIRDAHSHADANINVASSVMARISQKKKAPGEPVPIVLGGMLNEKPVATRTGHSWLVATFVFAMVMVAVFSVHRIQMSFAHDDDSYMSYVYEHFNMPSSIGEIGKGANFAR